MRVAKVVGFVASAANRRDRVKQTFKPFANADPKHLEAFSLRAD